MAESTSEGSESKGQGDAQSGDGEGSQQAAPPPEGTSDEGSSGDHGSSSDHGSSGEHEGDEKGGSGKAGTAAKAGAAGGALGFLKGRRGKKKRGEGSGGGGGGAQAVRGGVSVLGKIIAAIFTVLALIIIVGIGLNALGANQSNVIVQSVLGAGQFLVGPFDGVFQLSNRKTEVAVNWGIAAALYLIVGSVIGRILKR